MDDNNLESEDPKHLKERLEMTVNAYWSLKTQLLKANNRIAKLEQLLKNNGIDTKEAHEGT